MPDELQVTGGVTKALLAALEQIHTAVSARLVEGDGSPSKTALYMHLPAGQPIDPKMYSNPWTPAGSVYGAMSNTGGFAATPAVTPPLAPGAPASPAAQLATGPAPSEKQQAAINSAFNTAQRVDNMLMINNKGTAAAWPQKTVSISYWALLQGMQAEPAPEPSEEIKKLVTEAEKTLYLLDAEGNFTGYTPLHFSYRRNQKALADARSAYALAYAQAMTDPAAGSAWPISSGSLSNAVQQAYDDLINMGGKKIEEAMATLQSQGGSAAAALISKARKIYDDYNVGLAGAVANKVPWSYIDPVSWWDYTNDSFGVMKIRAESSHFSSSGSSGQHQFASSFYNSASSSVSGGASYKMFGFGASANASHSSTESNSGSSADQSSWSRHEDKSSSATIEFEWFIASIERPWLLGDLFHIEGWYLSGQKKHAISDGTIDGQLGDAPKLLPMIPKAFVVVRNVRITSDSWGSMGDAMASAVQSSSGHTESQSTNYGGSVGWFGLGGSVKKGNSSSSGAFSSQSDASQSWSFERQGQAGTLTINGAQIVGWIGQIQPPAPRKDDPNLGGEAPGVGGQDTPTQPNPQPVNG